MLLPAPFGPMTALIVPSNTSKETSSTAVSPPKRLVTPCTDSMLMRHHRPWRPPALRARILATTDRTRSGEPAGHEEHHEDDDDAVDVALPVLQATRPRPGAARG